MNSKKFLVILIIGLMALVLGACTSARASGATKLDSQIPEVVIKTKDYAFEVPDQIEAGLVSITMVNDGQEPHHAQMIRLNDGVTLEQFQAAMQESEAAAMGLMTLVGGPGLVDPGLSTQVTLELKPGQYVLLCFVPSHDGTPHLAKGMVQPFEVVAASAETATVAQPKAEATVKLQDFSFIFPTEVKAGKQTWQIVNEGTQPHEIMLIRLAEGKTLADAQAFAQAPHGQPPFSSIGGFQGITPGHSGWLNLDLQPGNYVALCYIPDPASGHAHMDLGMIMPFTVK